MAIVDPDILWSIAPSVVVAAAMVGGLKAVVNGSQRAIHDIDVKTDAILANQVVLREVVAAHTEKLLSHDQRLNQLDVEMYGRRRGD